MSIKWKARLAGLVPFLVYGAVVASCPWLRNFDITVHGWAWVVFFGGIVVFAIGSGFLSGFVKGLTGLEFTHPVARVLKAAVGWQVASVALWLAATLLPGTVSVSNAWAGIVLIALVGAACESSDIIEERILASDPSAGTK